MVAGAEGLVPSPVRRCYSRPVAQDLLNKKMSLLMGAACLILLLAGCGGGGDSQGTQAAQTGESGSSEVTVESGPLSKAQFVAQANKTCEATKKRIQEEYFVFAQKNKVPAAGPGVAGQAAEFVETIMGPLYQGQIERIAVLGAPGEDEETVSEIVDAMEQGLEEGRKKPLAFVRGAPFLHQASKLAVAYGLRSCTA